MKNEERWLDYKKTLNEESQRKSEVVEAKVAELRAEGKKIDTILVRSIIQGIGGRKSLYKMTDYLIDKYRRL